MCAECQTTACWFGTKYEEYYRATFVASQILGMARILVAASPPALQN